MATIECVKCKRARETKFFRILDHEVWAEEGFGAFIFSETCVACEDPLDHDTHTMGRDQLVAEIKRLRAGIRQHRDAEGHNLCWYVPELWELLPEKLDPRPRVPPVGAFLENCAKYRASLADDPLLQPVAWIPGQGLCFKKTDP